jgi:hypothetical protein
VFLIAFGTALATESNDGDDAEQFAMGVIGTVSLLLTQLRYEHPDRCGS